MNPLKSMERLFYAIFGQAEHNDLITVPIVPPPYRPHWTGYLFKIVWAVYKLLTVVVLLKLLIATMSDTYKQFQAQSDTEWKFGLSKLIRTIDLTTTAPSPINLVTTWLYYLIDLCRSKARKIQDQPMSPRSRAGSKWVSKLKRESDVTRRASVAASLLMNLNSSFDSQVAYNVHTRYLEYVINWPSIVRKYRALKLNTDLKENENNEESDEENEEGSEKGS